MNMTDMTLEELNAAEVEKRVGGVVFVSLLMVCGIIGNIHVLLVYSFKIKHSNHRVFILFLGVIDFLTCITGMPFVIIDLRNTLMFTIVAACKVLRFVSYFTCTASAATLLVIAVDRYRKICVPLGRQMSHTMAKLSCLLVLVVALLLSWPAPILFGKRTILTKNPNINGTGCSIEDRYKNTKYIIYFNAVLIVVALSVFFILVVLYGLIGRTIFKHKTSKSNPKCVNKTIPRGPASNSDKLLDIKWFEHDADRNKHTDANNEVLSEEMDFSTKVSEPIDFCDTTKSAPCSSDSVSFVVNKTKVTPEKLKVPVTKHTTNKIEKLKKTTLMMFLITLLFFFSYIPHFILMIIKHSMKGFVPGLNFTGQVFYNTFLNCVFINNVANVLIYALCDFRFRNEVKAAYIRLFKLLRII